MMQICVPGSSHNLLLESGNKLETNTALVQKTQKTTTWVLCGSNQQGQLDYLSWRISLE